MSLPHTGWRLQFLSLCAAAWNNFSAAARGCQAALKPNPYRSAVGRERGKGAPRREAASPSSRRQTARCLEGYRTAWPQRPPLCHTQAGQESQTVGEAGRRLSARSLTSPRHGLPQETLGGGALLPGLVVQLAAVRPVPLFQSVEGRLTLRKRETGWNGGIRLGRVYIWLEMSPDQYWNQIQLQSGLLFCSIQRRVFTWPSLSKAITHLHTKSIR